MRVGPHQGLDPGGDVGPLGVQGDELADQRSGALSGEVADIAGERLDTRTRSPSRDSQPKNVHLENEQREHPSHSTNACKNTSLHS